MQDIISFSQPSVPQPPSRVTQPLVFPLLFMGLPYVPSLYFLLDSYDASKTASDLDTPLSSLVSYHCTYCIQN
jgi:hypothetical protein